ncbi:unnamed protein product [Closterium sp. Naga37s-1]|nr:unnamed protein product [Closterium sp. Naga37s-1]
MELTHVHDDEPTPPVYPDIELDDDIYDISTLISGLGLEHGTMTAAEYVAIDDGEPTCAAHAADQTTQEPEAGLVVELWEAPTTMQAVYDDADPLRAFTALWNADDATSAVARFCPNLRDVLGWLLDAWTSVGARTIQRCWWRTGCLPLSWSMELTHVHDDEPTPPVYPDIELDDDIDDVSTLISGLGLGHGTMTAAEYVAIDDGEPTCAAQAADQTTQEPEAGLVVELWEAPTTMQAVYDDADPVGREARRTARAACEMLIGYVRATFITPRDLCHLFDIRNPIIIARMEQASPAINLNVAPPAVPTPAAIPTPDTRRAAECCPAG